MLGSLSYSRQQLEGLVAETRDHFDQFQRLPNFAYTSEAFLELEQLTLFSQNWIFAGLASRIPQAGDVNVVEVAGQSILLVRQASGEVKTFFNVCPHRGSRILEKPCAQQVTLTCPYHGWSFGLDGSPRLRPHFHGGGRHEMDPKGEGMTGLFEVRSHQWLDFVYVNLDGKAEPFDSWMSPVLSALAPYDFSDLSYVRSIEFDLESNWKLAVENFWDTYHIFSCHPAVDKQMPMEDRDNARVEGKIVIGGYQYPASKTKEHAGRDFAMPNHGGDQSYIKNRSWFICCCPSNMLQVWEDAVIMVEMRPISPSQTKEWFHYFVATKEAASSDEFADKRDAVIGFMVDFQMEDMDIVRWMQEGRGSSAFKGGELSPFWDPQVIDFSRLVTNEIQGRPTNR